MTSTKTRNAAPDDEDPDQPGLSGHPCSKDSGGIRSRFSSARKKIPLTQEDKIDKMAERILVLLKRTADIRLIWLNQALSYRQKIQLTGAFPDPWRSCQAFCFILITNLLGSLQGLIQRGLKSRNEPGFSTQAQQSAGLFLELARQNILFCDHRERPLYTLEQMRGKHGYTASEEVLAPMILENMIQAFHEASQQSSEDLVPITGFYAGQPLAEIMQAITETEILAFLSTVQDCPTKYADQTLRLTEAFAEWVLAGTPTDLSV